jgi:hypothetical protein
MQSCAHERRAYPNLLAHICGWDAQLADLEKRLRRSKCEKKAAGFARLKRKSRAARRRRIKDFQGPRHR